MQMPPLGECLDLLLGENVENMPRPGKVTVGQENNVDVQGGKSLKPVKPLAGCNKKDKQKT